MMATAFCKKRYSYVETVPDIIFLFVKSVVIKRLGPEYTYFDKRIELATTQFIDDYGYREDAR